MLRPLPHWLTYDAEVDGAAARIRCDLSLFDHEARPAGSKTLFVLGADLNEPGDAGLGSPKEQAAIERAQDTLGKELSKFSVAIAGSMISKGTWQTVFYGSPTLEEDLIPTAQKPLRAEGWTDWIHAELDPDWESYGAFLLPPTIDRIRALNGRATQALRDSNHDLSQPRTLTHTLAFPSPEAAELSLSSIVALDFQLAGPTKTLDGDYTKAKVARQDPPDHAESASLMLSELCAPYDGDHVQWIATD